MMDLNQDCPHCSSVKGEICKSNCTANGERIRRLHDILHELDLKIVGLKLEPVREIIELEPVDINQCQAEQQTGSFMSLGVPKMVRCKNKPMYIATECNPDDNGQIGMMSLCESCAKRLAKSMGEDYATLERIKSK